MWNRQKYKQRYRWNRQLNTIRDTGGIDRNTCRETCGMDRNTGRDTGGIDRNTGRDTCQFYLIIRSEEKFSKVKNIKIKSLLEFSSVNFSLLFINSFLYFESTDNLETADFLMLVTADLLNLETVDLLN